MLKCSLAGGCVWPKIKFIQTLMGVLVTCKNEEDPFKMKVLEWSQHISHCKSMQILYDAHSLTPQLTPQSEVGYTLNSNSYKLLWLSLYPARTKKIKSKMKALEWSQHYPSILGCSRTSNSIVGDGTLTNSKSFKLL